MYVLPVGVTGCWHASNLLYVLRDIPQPRLCTALLLCFAFDRVHVLLEVGFSGDEIVPASTKTITITPISHLAHVKGGKNPGKEVIATLPDGSDIRGVHLIFGNFCILPAQICREQ